MNLSHLKLGQRLGLGFGLVLALLAGIVALSVWQLASSANAVNVMNDYQERAGMAASWTGKTSLNVSRAVAIAKAGDQSAKLQAYFAPQIAQTSAEINELQKTLQQRISSDQGKALFATVGERRTAYVSARDEVFAQMKKGDQAAADLALNERMLPASQRYLDSMVALQRFQTGNVDRHVAAVQGRIQNAETVLLALLGVGLVAGLLLAIGITRSVTRPLGEAVAAARVIADGDLSREIRTTRRDETGELLQSLAHMQNSLRGLVGQVRSATDSIGTASAEIATGNHDLSARTEQTAANLEEAASSMEQLTGTVRQSADSARQANQLATSAAEVAVRGGVVVSQVVATMEEINTSSKKIADIISVIDGIAFQTNILALNAAVEAARAGEQGRGFAVVAGEVRSLAQRSAEAAKEIKSLIGASVERVDTGSRLVGDAGRTMQEIVTSVQRVTDMIAEITVAAAEQSDGIGQVNGAVNHLDQMTQQNAALVEQSAAAAASLKDQAGRLAAMVATFRLA